MTNKLNKVFEAMKNSEVLNKVRVVDVRNSAFATKSLEETEFHHAFVVNGDSIGYTFSDDDRPQRIVMSFIAATSSYLSRAKIAEDTEAVALILLDLIGNFKFAAIVKYNLNADNPDEEGNWDYTFTFNEEDLAEVEASRTVKKYLYSDTVFYSLFDKIAYDVASVQFEQERYMYDACCLTIDTILQILDNEAVEGEKVTIEMPKYFSASVEVDNDVKIFGMVPDGQQKKVIAKFNEE